MNKYFLRSAVEMRCCVSSKMTAHISVKKKDSIK